MRGEGINRRDRGEIDGVASDFFTRLMLFYGDMAFVGTCYSANPSSHRDFFARAKFWCGLISQVEMTGEELAKQA